MTSAPTSANRPAGRLTLTRSITIGALCLGGLGLIALMYAAVATQSNVAMLDLPVTEWAASHRTPLLTAIMLAITHVFSPYVISAVVIIGGIIWMWRKKEYWRPLLGMLSIGIAFLVGLLVKEIVARERPPIADMVPPAEIGYSFPSNHTFGIAIFLLVVGYILYTKWPSKRYLIVWIATTICGIAIMAASRIYLGYHWLTDVTASVGLALIVLAVVVLLDTLHAARRHPTKAL